MNLNTKILHSVILLILWDVHQPHLIERVHAINNMLGTFGRAVLNLNGSYKRLKIIQHGGQRE